MSPPSALVESNRLTGESCISCNAFWARRYHRFLGQRPDPVKLPCNKGSPIWVVHSKENIPVNIVPRCFSWLSDSSNFKSKYSDHGHPVVR